MLERFQGQAGHRLLLETLQEQILVGGNRDLAETLAADGQLMEFAPGENLVVQGGGDNDIYFILTGTCQVLVYGRPVAQRGAGTHIGEMAAIQPSQVRSATVTAIDDCVALKISEECFSAAANTFPAIWRQVAKELARRLIQRNNLVTATHEKIRVFVMSSAESLGVARAIQNAFEHDPFNIVIWTDGVFRASSYPLIDLEAQLDSSDFAIAIAHADDAAVVRGTSWPVPRDNVTLELGMFIGRLGRERAFLIERRGDETRLPSDLAGLTTLPYRWSGDPKELALAVAPVCNRLRDIFEDLGAK